MTISNNPRQSRKKRIARNIRSYIVTVIIAAVIALAINQLVIINSVVPTGSMEPTVMTGSRLFGLRVNYLFSDPARGDVVVFRFPDDPSIYYVKRIIGLPGETVEIRDGCVYVDGEVIEETYLTVTTEGEFGPYVVPEGCYFVMGDNRNNSYDSRYWENTYVPEDYIIGRVYLCYWPVNEIHLLE